MYTIGIDMMKSGGYNPPDILTPDLIRDLVDSRPLYPEGTMDLLYELTMEGIETEVLQCRYHCEDRVEYTLLEIINRGLSIDVQALEERISFFKEFCDLEQIHGTASALALMGKEYDEHCERELRSVRELSEGSLSPSVQSVHEGEVTPVSKTPDDEMEEQIRDLHPIILLVRKKQPDTLLAEGINTATRTRKQVFSRGSPLRGPLQLAKLGEQWPGPRRPGPQTRHYERVPRGASEPYKD
jgi:hypothetical protein